MDHIFLEPESKNLDAWSRNLKIQFRLHSPSLNAAQQISFEQLWS